jgi:hypothetical protein
MAGYKKIGREEAESLALRTLSYIASDGDRLSRFLGVTGLSPETIRQSAASPGFFAAVLDYVAADESLLIELSGFLETRPEHIMEAHRTLSPQEFD